MGLGVLFVIGAALGGALGAVFFLIALVRGGRPVHHEGVVLRAELHALDAAVGPRLAGPVLIRLSGAFEGQQTQGPDVLGLLVRTRSATQAPGDPTGGDQDLLLGTFESFRTAARDRAATNTTDYLENRYSSVTPWWIPGVGPATLHLERAPRVPDGRAPASVASPEDASTSRLDRLDRALAGGTARMVLSLSHPRGRTEIAELCLLERASIDARRVRASMFRAGRGIRPLGFRNGLRAFLYPMSQLGRSLRAR